MITENKLVKKFNGTDLCVLNIDAIVKSYNYRFTIFENLYNDIFEFIKYLRKDNFYLKLDFNPISMRRKNNKKGLFDSPFLYLLFIFI